MGMTINGKKEYKMVYTKNQRTQAAWRLSNELNISIEEAETRVTNIVLEQYARHALGKSLEEANLLFKQSKGVTFTEWYLTMEGDADAAGITMNEYLEKRRKALQSRQEKLSVEGKPNTYYMVDNGKVCGEVTHNIEKNEIIAKPYTEFAAKKLAKQYANLTGEGMQIIILPVEEQ